ncbi:MAG: velvet protein [Bogoriella megaspora]|nr:MAG: velvet protein [Bogoriella megaspora]
MASTIPVSNETQSTASRVTKEGRRISYHLKVIQPPERARACGSGAKSSADRRPVDPPPIVELRILQDESEDITFAYNANFFLFATLENARSIAQGRVPQTQTNFPVLTGTPVAGMAYLDRPQPAGYFIFPDLSVRHEGKYRLSFSLYEELKEAKDADKDESPASKTTNPGTPTAGHVSYRLDVKSTPFIVYSAKKFPGLAESTSLSRIVAEQGCRVRIRRDVRMRRRENKGSGKNWDDYEDDYEGARRASATPDRYGQSMGTPHTGMESAEHQRRLSNASQASLHPSHRSSATDLASAYQAQNYGQAPIAPQTPQQAYPQPTQFNQPSYPQQTAYAPQPAAMQPPPQQYHQPPPPPSTQYQPQPQPMHAQPQYNNYMPGQSYPPPQPYDNSHARHDSYGYDHEQYRRQTMPQIQPQPHAGYHSHQNSMSSLDYNRPPSIVQPTRPPQPAPAPAPTLGNALPPLKTHFPTNMDKLEPSSPASAMPIPMSASAHSNGMPPMPVHYPTTPQSALPSATIGKRSYGQTFDTRPIQQPLRQGARPSGGDGNSPNHGMYDGTYDEVSDSESSEDLMYKRADGTQSHRKLPATQ